MPEDIISKAYVVLNDDETFSPLYGSHVGIAPYNDNWEEITEAPVEAIIEIAELLKWALDHGFTYKKAKS